MLRDVKHLLHTAAYHPAEIERILDPDNPSFIDFDPVLGYVLRDYDFNDGMDGIRSDYTYEPHGGHRKMIHYRERPCRINTYGDSFTQCAQVSNGETWQEILAAHFHEPIRNFGVGGYGVYQAYRRALRTEQIEDLAAGHIVLNIWDDDHLRNLDAARWIRVAWMCRDLPRGGKNTYPVHGFPWAHLRYDVDAGTFVERPGLCEKAQDLRRLVGQEAYCEAFKDDSLAHLYALREGGEAPVEEAERVAEAFGVTVDLRNPGSRAGDARRLHLVYGQRSTQFLLEQFRVWANANGRKLMVLLSYDVPAVREYLERGTRFDGSFVKWLDANGFRFVDTLQLKADEFTKFNVSIDEFISRFYIGRAGAQVFGHYNPYGNFWFGFAVRQALVDWMDPKPASYR